MPLSALGVDAPLNELKADLFKALAHPVRVRALELLAAQPHTVAEMLAATGMEASHLSQHLAVLRRSGLVTAQREGNSVVYQLADPEVASLLVVSRTVLINALRTGNEALTELLAHDASDGSSASTAPASSANASTATAPATRTPTER